MTCLHNHDQNTRISTKNIFETFSDLPKLSLCFKFGWVILILCPFLQISLDFLQPMSEELCRDKPSIYGVLWKLIDPCFFCYHGSMGFPKTPYRRLFPRHNYTLIGRKYQAKFENDCISRSGHRFKITQPNLMILVSFSSAEDALSNDVKQFDIFSSQSTENPPFCFFGTPGIVMYQKYITSLEYPLKSTLLILNLFGYTWAVELFKKS